MSVEFTSEQKDFAAAIADFCKRESGTREQRDRLTNHGEHNHNQDVYEKMAKLAGWASPFPRSTTARPPATSTCASCSRRQPRGWHPSAASVPP